MLALIDDKGIGLPLLFVNIKFLSLKLLSHLADFLFSNITLRNISQLLVVIDIVRYEASVLVVSLKPRTPSLVIHAIVPSISIFYS